MPVNSCDLFSLREFFLWGFLSIAVTLFAYLKGFYQCTASPSRTRLTIFHVIAFLGLTFGIPFFLAWLLLHKVNITLLRLLLTFSPALLLLLLLTVLSKQDRKSIFKRSPTSMGKDWIIGIFSWALIFPPATLLTGLCDRVVYALFHICPHDQTAVVYLKQALSSPLSLTLALTTIVLLAPFVEELLFRGILQTYFRQRFSTKNAVLLSSALFALMHLDIAQGVTNLSIFVTLFSLSCFLGFLYEKQGSLFSCIALHATFNTINAAYILS